MFILRVPGFDWLTQSCSDMLGVSLVHTTNAIAFDLRGSYYSYLKCLSVPTIYVLQLKDRRELLDSHDTASPQTQPRRVFGR